MSSVGLLDVNVLVALVVPHHVHHDIAQHWLRTHGIVDGWATCPVTELGTIRVCGQNKQYNLKPEGTVALLVLMRRFKPRHVFWSEPSPTRVREVVETPIEDARHVPDHYLLGLARRKRAQIITFDRRLAAFGNKDGRQDVVCLLSTDHGPITSS